MNPLLEQFLNEGRDLLEQVGHILLKIEETPNDSALIGELFRLVHTLKGNSGLFEFQSLTRVVHAAEDLMDLVRDGVIAIDPELIDELLSAMDFVLRLIDQIEETEHLPASYDAEAAQLVTRLREYLPAASDALGAESPAQEIVQGIPAPADWSWLLRLTEATRVSAFKATSADPTNAGLFAVRYQPEPECFFKGEDPLLILRNVPQRLGFSVQSVTPWGPLADLDVYQCNLLLDALSGASLAEITDHFRYVPEQVAYYPLPAYALALPEGAPDSNAAVMDDFISMASGRLKIDDRNGLRSAVDAMLEMISPALWTASALRWCQRLLEVNAPRPVLAMMLEAIANQVTPDWKSLSLSDMPVLATIAIAEAPATPAQKPDDIAPENTAQATPKTNTGHQLDPAAEAMWQQMLATQRRLLDLPVQASQWAGRLSALRNTLGSLYQTKGDDALIQQLNQAVEAAQQAHSFAPLISFLEGDIAELVIELVIEPAIDSVNVEATKPVVVTAKLEVPASIEVTATVVSKGLEPRIEIEDASSEQRNEEVSVDRGNRILKVPQEKVDRLMDLIGEMVVAKNALPYLAARAEDVFGSRELSREIKSQYAVINRIAEEMQDGIMQVRMLPVSAVFQRFPRLVRDVSKSLNKKVRLILEGEDTEADKHIVESVGDPLIHIIRNSLDHGIESPAVRLAAGKPEEGRITVRASQQSDRVIIEIIDDGKGIDPSIVKRKAFEKGLIDEHRLDTISDEDAVQLVFAAGFSTKEIVSDLSGRGVGMDVVKTSLSKIGGQVSLTSTKGFGTRIVLTLPLSMAVSDVMMVHVGDQRFGVPMDLVVETVRISERQIHLMKNRRTIMLRGKIVPLFGADELLSLAEPTVANADGDLSVLITRIGADTVGVIVDGFAQTIDVILKPLEGPLAGLSGIGGTALLGDGSVLLVLDLKELF